MLADHWLDLQNPVNRRGHPVLAAMLYLFCPASARWWLAGADPVVPFDPFLQAHRLRASGRMLREVLEGWGLGDLTGHARKYVEQVEAFRQQPQHRHLLAPELLPTFLGGKLPVAARHGLSAEFERIGGWRNFYPFIRAWAFSLRDWQAALGWTDVPQMERTGIESTVFSAEPVHVTVWKLSGKDRSELGLIVSEADNTAWIAEWILLLLGPRFSPDLLSLLDTGRVERVEPSLGEQVLRDIVGLASGLAQNGPYLPVNALNDPSRCRRCGFRHLCWADGERSLTPIALSF